MFVDSWYLVVVTSSAVDDGDCDSAIVVGLLVDSVVGIFVSATVVSETVVSIAVVGQAWVVIDSLNVFFSWYLHLCICINHTC